MPRTWGYIIVVLAAFVGAGALLLPVPEEIEVEKVETPPSASPPKSARPTPSSPAAGRAASKKSAAESPPAPPAPPPAAKANGAPATRPFPMQDTTKTRTMVQPKPPEN